MKRYPLEPLLEAAGLSANRFAVSVGASGTMVRYAREQGLLEDKADLYATRLGLVPWLVWADWLDDAETECAHPDCTARFVPSRAGHRFCSARCRRSDGERRARALGLPSALNKLAYRRRYYQENGDYERARQRAYDRARRAVA